MPKTPIDYSNTSFYKIYCKDARVTDVYVGHTTNFIKRKNSHKSIAESYSGYNDELVYKTIRLNGGWDNWNMVELEKCSCVNRGHALKKEMEYTIVLKANLNSKPQISMRANEFICQKCNNNSVTFIDYNNHVTECQKNVLEDHKRLFVEIINESVVNVLTKSKTRFHCNYCNYGTETAKDYNKHLKTKKHERNSKIKYIIQEKPSSDIQYELLNDRFDSLTNHKDNHIGLIEELIKQSNEFKEIFREQTKEMHNSMMEQQKVFIEQNNKLIELSTKQNTTLIQNNTTNNTTTTNNNSFNLNLFLNEQCKDAISITDFVESLNLDSSDIKATGQLGYVLGISRIFINKLKEMDVYERPLHCTDYKRETVYIKNEDTWEKDNQEKSKLRHIVSRIARKNLEQLPAWQHENPDYVTLDTPENNEFMKISLSSLGGYSNDEENKHVDKIMRNVLKEVVVSKSCLLDT